MHHLLLLLSCFLSFTSSIIDYSTMKISWNSQLDSYFGYSILLQSGNPPIAIIGAPRTRRGTKMTGAVFKQDLTTFFYEEYYRLSSRNALLGKYVVNKTGDFLGSVLDGDNSEGGAFYTCAPRFVTSHNFDDNFHINGRCFYLKYSSYVSQDFDTISLDSYPQISFYKFVAYHDIALAEVGLDISYRKEQGELIAGAPGKAHWNGALFSIKHGDDFLKPRLFFDQPDWNNFQFSLLGYAVAWGKFLKPSNRVWYVSGAPRGEYLKGMVVFFDENVRNVTVKLVGEAFGSYFGSSLLVVPRPEGDDILVGAPTFSGETYDEGCVYYYKNTGSGSFESPVKLSNKKPASRFGTLIVDAGDIDLDSFPDCMISAPYENDGVGAVYIYFGTKDGFSNDKFHRIDPSQFSTLYPKTVIKGFGLGVARAVDINSDKHNDIAIGAYQSGHVIYFKSRPVVDIETKITSDQKLLYTSSTKFSTRICLKFAFRNGAASMQWFNTTLLLLDERVRNEKRVSRIFGAKSNEWVCQNHTVSIKSNHFSAEPLVVRFRYNHTLDEFREDVLSLPMTYGCGSDNICQTDLAVDAESVDTTEIVFGLNTDLKVNVRINNSGEAAYQARLFIDLPPDVSLINLRECNLINGSYVCLVADEFKSRTEKIFFFDLDNLKPNRTSFTIHFSVNSLGQDVNISDNSFDLKIPVLLRSNPGLFSQSTPDKMVLNKTRTSLSISHNFVLGNQGPSPFDLDLTILVPQFVRDGVKILEIENVEGATNGMVTECKILATPLYDILDQKSKNFTCDDAMNCTRISCDVGSFYKSSENTVFILRLSINVQLLVKLYKNLDQLVISSNAYFNNGTREFRTTASTLIYGMADDSKIPLWIYLVSVISGMSLLVFIVLGLYKCNFFARTYKDRLENEQFERDAFVEESNSEEM